VPAGLVVGGGGARRVPRERARQLALSVAFLGAIAALVRGLVG